MRSRVAPVLLMPRVAPGAWVASLASCQEIGRPVRHCGARRYHGRMTTPKSFPDWETLYRQQPGETLPWYYADLDPDLEAALREHGLAGGRLLDLGTGPGTQAIALAARGFEVTGSDLSATAVAKATTLARAREVDVTFVEDDVLASRLTGRFDAVFDRGCFHVIDPARRGAYVDAVAGWVAPGGLLLLKTFSALQPGDVGPHRFAPAEIRATFASRFELLSATETVYQGTLDPLPKALFCVLRRLHVPLAPPHTR